MRTGANSITLRGGFTLIELLVVMAVISLLSSIIFASLGQARSKARDSRRVQDLIQLRTALELYAVDNNDLYPPDPAPITTLYRASCWDCVATPSLHDPDRLLTLEPYLKIRPGDPQAPFSTAPEDHFWGYWYKVSESRRYYKATILGSIEDLNNVPSAMVDQNYYSVHPNSISIYSNDISKSWTLDQQVSCSDIGDC